MDCLKLLLFVPHVHHARLNSVMHNFAKLKFTFHDGSENFMQQSLELYSEIHDILVSIFYHCVLHNVDDLHIVMHIAKSI